MHQFNIVECATGIQLGFVKFRQLPMRGDLVVVGGLVYKVMDASYENNRTLFVTKARLDEAKR